ncbi:TatD family hydrolase [Niallia sp. 01092]|uniref:TatD family hydrolase n=1 Tax=unclassified Niallia TaxID=2837522 RepID=UPI003FD6AD40
MKKIIDAHIHLDQYEQNEIGKMEQDESLEAVITVSMNKNSCIKNKLLTEKYPFVHAAYGFHPEQLLPSEKETTELFQWINEHHHRMIAIGEVGLPHYARKENPALYPLDPYIELVEQFILMAKKYTKPIVLHSIYEEAPIVLRLLEKHNYMNAQFHWFKGDAVTIEQLINNKCYVSITPDVLYEDEIRKLVKKYPLDQLMVETDGPWPFEGPFHLKKTTSSMIHHTINEIALLKKEQVDIVYTQLFTNTKRFFSI